MELTHHPEVRAKAALKDEPAFDWQCGGGGGCSRRRGQHGQKDFVLLVNAGDIPCLKWLTSEYRVASQ